MPRPFSRRLVVDASIARSSGDAGAIYPTSVRCRACLLTIIDDTPHRAVFSPDLADEWDRNQSAFARRWRFAMQRQGRLMPVATAEDERLRERVEGTAEGEEQRAAIAKDVHLITLARAADRTVLSLDERMRRLLRRACPRVRELRPIVWVNPDREDEAAAAWLRQGARPDVHRRLDFLPEEK